MGESDLTKRLAIPGEILAAIHTIRGQRAMLDEDLARLYGVETKVLNQAVHRNPERFPVDFMFQLSREEWDGLRSQSVTSNEGRGGRRYAPLAFTQEGVAMLSGVLNSQRAIAVNIEIMRAFVRFRMFLANHEELAAKLKDLEFRFERKANQQDNHLRMLVEAMRQLREEVRKSIPRLAISTKPKRRIGFRAEEEDATPPKPKAPRKAQDADRP